MEREQIEQLFAGPATGERFVPAVKPVTEAGLPPEPPAADPDDLLAALQRIERLLGDMDGRLEAVTREGRHREFSPAWLCGALLQALVAGFVIAALADWTYQAELGKLLTKLLFAGVFQLSALTAFFLARK